MDPIQKNIISKIIWYLPATSLLTSLMILSKICLSKTDDWRSFFDKVSKIVSIQWLDTLFANGVNSSSKCREASTFNV